MGRVLALVPLLSLSVITSLAAQERTGPIEFRVGAALGIVKTDVSRESSTDVGPLVTAQLGWAVSRAIDLTADVIFQPFEAENPLGFEQYTAISVLAGAQIGLGESKRTFVRPGLGLAFASWSGEDPWVESSTSLAFGIAAGRELAIGEKLGLVLEGGVLVWSDDGLSSLTLSLGGSIVPIGARPRE